MPKYIEWSLEHRNFLVKTLEVGGPTLRDLTALCLRGLKGQDLKLYLLDLKLVIQGNTVNMRPHIDKLLAIKPFTHTIVEYKLPESA